jgi:hypothetical protein
MQVSTMKYVNEFLWFVAGEASVVQLRVPA